MHTSFLAECSGSETKNYVVPALKDLTILERQDRHGKVTMQGEYWCFRIQRGIYGSIGEVRSGKK